MKTEISSKDLFRLVARQNEVVKRVENGGLSIEDALVGTQGILDRLYHLNKDIVNNFAQYTCFLRPLSQQAVELRKLNEKMPSTMRVPDTWFTHLHTTSDHAQRVDNLEFFFIVPKGTLNEVLEYQLKLVELSQPGFWVAGCCHPSRISLRLDATAYTELFERPGIYRCYINLVSYWYPSNSISVDQTREQAVSTDTKLAGLPAIGAYAAQNPKLYQSQDGENLPFFDIAELLLDNKGICGLYSLWDRGNNKVYFYSDDSDDIDVRFARPSFVKKV